jgi:Tol biopolymer transport system component
MSAGKMLASVAAVALMPVLWSQATADGPGAPLQGDGVAPTLEELGGRRLCVGCPGQASTNGAFVYVAHDVGLVRIETSKDHAGVTWDRVHRVVVEPAWPGKRAVSPPVISPDGSLVAFGERGGVVHIVSAATGEPRHLLSDTSWTQPLAWFADGTGVLVATRQGALLGVSLATQERVVVASPGDVHGSVRWPAASPDGRFVAYMAAPADHPDDEGDLYVAATDGSWRAPLVQLPSEQRAPRWTPDGRSVLFTNDRGEAESFTGDLWIVDVRDGRADGVPRRLVRAPHLNTSVVAKAMTPGGMLIAQHVGKTDDLWSIRIDPTTHELIGAPWRTVGDSLTRRGGNVSPDGSQMAFVTRGVLPGVPSWAPGIRDLATRTDRFLDVPTEWIGDWYMPPTWSPDGRYLMFTMRYRQGVYLFDVVNGEHGWLVEGAEGERIGAFGWLPEGHTVVYGVSRRADDGEMLSVRRHDVATGSATEVWRGVVGSFLTFSNHLSPDGRYVTLPRTAPDDGRALWILDLEIGEMRELTRSANVYFDLGVPYLSFNEWTRDSREIVTTSMNNEWLVNERPRESVFWAIPLSTGVPRRLGSVSIPYGDEWFGARYFSLHPGADTLTFTDGGAIDEIWLVDHFDEVVAR